MNLNPKAHIVVYVLLVIISLNVRAQDRTALLLGAEKSLINGDTLTAIDQFHQVLVAYPQSFAASMRLAEVYYGKEDYQTAVQYCNIALDINNNYYNKALDRLQPTNKLSKSERDREKEKIGHYKSDQADVLHLKGLIRARQSRRKDAIEAFRSALEIKVDSQTLTDLALTYLETGHLQDAILLLHNARRLDTADYKAYFNLANVHYKIQNLDSALYYYNITKNKAPDLKWPYLYTGLIHTKNKQYEKAVDQYTQFIMLDSTDEEVYFRRAVLWSELRQWKKALQDWEQVLKINPDNVEAWRNKGLSYFQSAQYDSAILAFDKALELLPEESYTYINRGYSHYLADHPKRALSDLDKGLEGLPNYYLGYYFRALVHLQMRDKEKACSDIKQAIALGMQEEEINKKLLRRCF